MELLQVEPARQKFPGPLRAPNGRPLKSRTGYATFDLFQYLSAEAQEGFALACRRRLVPAGRRVYSQSEPATEFFRIASGSIRVSVLRDDGREALQSVLQTGDCFGICSMIDGGTRYQTTTANEAVELQVLHREACERLRSQHSSFGDGLVRHMSRHSRLLSDYFVSSTLDELSSRVAMRLLGLSVALSQSEIALMVGASRQAVNKVLQKFQVDGLIHIEYGSVRLLDIERLRCLV